MKKDGFVADAMIAGVVMGVCIFLVRLLSVWLQWELNGVPGQGWIIFAILVAGTIFFGRRHSALAGPAGFSYGRSMGFIALSMVAVSVISGLGEVIIHKMIAVDYYEQVIAKNMAEAKRIMAANPFFRGDKAALNQGLSMGRALAENSVYLFFGTFFGRIFLGAFVGLFTSLAVKRDPDPFYEAPRDGQQA